MTTNKKTIKTGIIFLLLSLVLKISSFIFFYPSVYFQAIITNILWQLPDVLILISTILFYKTAKPQKLFTISYIAYGALLLIDLIDLIGIYNYYFLLCYSIKYILLIAFYGLLTFATIKGVKNKNILLSAIILIFVIDTAGYIYNIYSTFFQFDFMFLISKAIYLVSIVFYYLSLIKIAPNTIRIVNNKTITPVTTINYEAKLSQLKNQYDSGQITLEEYNTKRTEILNKL